MELHTGGIISWSEKRKCQASIQETSLYNKSYNSKSFQRICTRPITIKEKLEKQMNVQKMRYRTKRAREEVYHERKMKSLNQINKQLDLQRKSENAEIRREEYRKKFSERRIQKAYERLEKKSGILKTLSEWDSKDFMEGEKFKNEKSSNDGFLKKFYNEKQTDTRHQKKESKNNDKSAESFLPELVTDKSMELKKAVRKFISSIETKRQSNQASCSLKKLQNDVDDLKKLPKSFSQRRHSFDVGSIETLPQHELMLSSHIEPGKIRNEVHSRQKSEDKLLSRVKSLMLPRNMESESHLISSSSKLYGRRHSISTSLSPEIIHQLQVQRNRALTKSVESKKWSRHHHNESLNFNLRDFQAIKHFLKMGCTLNYSKGFTAEDAWKNLNTSYLRLTHKNINYLEKLCSDAGLDASNHPHLAAIKTNKSK